MLLLLSEYIFQDIAVQDMRHWLLSSSFCKSEAIEVFSCLQNGYVGAAISYSYHYDKLCF